MTGSVAQKAACILAILCNVRGLVKCTGGRDAITKSCMAGLQDTNEYMMYLQCMHHTRHNDAVNYTRLTQQKGVI